MERLKLNEDYDTSSYFFREDLSQGSTFHNLNEKLHHMESFKK